MCYAPGHSQYNPETYKKYYPDQYEKNQRQAEIDRFSVPSQPSTSSPSPSGLNSENQQTIVNNSPAPELKQKFNFKANLFRLNQVQGTQEGQGLNLNQ